MLKNLLENAGYNVVALLMRCFLFGVFFTSGNNKLDNLWAGDWQQTISLFEEVHPVPYVNAQIAAVLGTGAEVICGALMLMGLCARFAAFGLLCVTAAIEASFHMVDPEYVTFDVHIMWALLLGALICKGAGAFSVDWLLFSKKT